MAHFISTYLANATNYGALEISPTNRYAMNDSKNNLAVKTRPIFAKIPNCVTGSLLKHVYRMPSFPSSVALRFVHRPRLGSTASTLWVSMECVSINSRMTMLGLLQYQNVELYRYISIAIPIPMWPSTQMCQGGTAHYIFTGFCPASLGVLLPF